MLTQSTLRGSSFLHQTISSSEAGLKVLLFVITQALTQCLKYNTHICSKNAGINYFKYISKCEHFQTSQKQRTVLLTAIYLSPQLNNYQAYAALASSNSSPSPLSGSRVFLNKYKASYSSSSIFSLQNYGRFLT